VNRRLAWLVLFAVPLGGCGDEKKPTSTSLLPPPSEVFDKSGTKSPLPNQPNNKKGPVGN
jgi:hypothetical protein